ncbi:MAG: hypothetical protein ACTSQK_05815 [Candidatus Heimdallarchaeota archaeon]
MINNDNNNPDGIFVLNSQIFSVNDLINAMRKQGLRIHLTRDGLSIDGEQITSISSLDENKCPLAGTCEKRVALVEFLKLQKTQNAQENYHRGNRFEQEASPDIFSRSNELEDLQNRREDSRRDFIKPNNHDLFEGNVSNSPGLFDEPVEEIRGLFDEPDLFTEPETKQFEDSFYRDDSLEEKSHSQDDMFSDTSRRRPQQESEQPFCPECGFDIQPSWNTCPNCSHKITRRVEARNKNRYFQ